LDDPGERGDYEAGGDPADDAFYWLQGFLAWRHGLGVGPALGVRAGGGVTTGVAVAGAAWPPRSTPVTSFAPLQLATASRVPRASSRYPTNLFMTDSSPEAAFAQANRPPALRSKRRRRDVFSSESAFEGVSIRTP
jgi:hypothetical protein